ncbi:MAG: substrate-binding domain-containing protein [Bacteroidales bacterium]|nr:substrate-binding domain-containing protein [Bacteroidales bacterium]
MNHDLQREAMLYEDIILEIKSSNGDTQKQIADISSFIDEGVDLLIVSPNEAVEIAPMVEKAYDNGIPVIIVDRKVMTDHYSSFVGADNRQIGAATGTYIKQLLPLGGNVLEITGLMGSSPAIERHEGFCSTALTDSAIHLLYSVDAGWFKQEAFERTKEILSKTPNIDVVFAHNDEMASGAYEAAQMLGLGKRIKFIGIDALPGRSNGIGMVSDGILEASFVYPSGTDKVMRLAYDILSGHDYPREIILNTTIVDRSNVRVIDMYNSSIAEQERKFENLNAKLGSFSAAYKSQRIMLYLSMILVVMLVFVLVALVFILRSRSRMNKQLVEFSRQVEEAASAKMAFFTNISHELRTPLTLISGSVDELIGKTSESDSNYELLNLAKRNTNILLRLVNQILDFRKYENGKLDIKRTSVNVKGLVESWNASFIPMLKRKHLRFSFVAEPGQDYMNSIDVDKMEQVYYNLLSNAFKYTPENESVVVRLGRKDNIMVLSVTNTGTFIPQSERENIFDRFYQIGNGGGQGTGIGLAIVKAFVNMHKGVVGVESDRRKGTTFSVSLPISEEQDTNAVLSAQLSASSHGDMIEDISDVETEDKDRRTVLVVDDSEDIRTLVRIVLGGEYLVLEACDGEEGFKKALAYVPDIIIMDVMMPKMDGVACCARLKQEMQTCHIPVIMLTACAADEKRVEGYSSGADSYITKPFRSEVLTTRIQNLLNRREQVQKSFDGPSGISLSANMEEMDKQFINQFRCFVEDHIDRPDLDLDALANHLAMSRIQLWRKLKGLTNHSPNEWVRIIRLRRAQQMLATTDLSIAEICYDTGFSTPSYFTKCYKDYFGELPNEYRKRIRK